MIIKTSGLGYTCESYTVETNATVEDIRKIDSRYGAQTRFHSTDITDLEKGAIKEGFTFKYTKNENCSIKEDYFARFGNY